MYHLNPNQTPRKNLRLKNYDYSKAGLYFITISVQNKLCLFWKIENNKMEIFESGKIIEQLWLELENKFENVKLHNFVVMPNHFHGILEIVKQNILNNPVGADLCVCPDNGNVCSNDENVCPDDGKNNDLLQHSGWTHRFTPTNGEFIYDKNSFSSIIQWFKTMITNAYIKLVHQNKANNFNKKLWQRNFYEHIIRDENEYFKISKYIDENVEKWEEDKFYYTEI